MGKLLKRILLCFVFTATVWTVTLFTDRERLNHELIRLHVVAASDTEEDQRLKLRVRDAVLESICEDLEKVADVEAAKEYLNQNVQKIETVANSALQREGSEDTVSVSFGKEQFDIRRYDTFSLPAGVYDALRITIGEGKGENWWCVAFPSLCVGATASEFEAIAAGAGFPDTLTAALEGKTGYRIRFYLLDLIGALQNKRMQE